MTERRCYIHTIGCQMNVHDSEQLALRLDRLGYRQVPLWLTDEELEEVTEELRSVLRRALHNQPTPARRRRLLTTIVMPDVRAPRQPR